MSLLEKILPGSYKGVNFLMIAGTTTGGPKVVKHEYPNSNTQTIETLGLKPRTYSVTILIGGGDNYLVTRDQLLRILEDETLGKLTHPLYGDIENVIALPYTLTEGFDSLGEGRISVVFEVSEGTGVPERTDSTINTVEVDHNAVLEDLNASFTEDYGIESTQPETYTDALDKGQELDTSLTNNVKAAQGATDKINEYTGKLAEFSSNITSLVSDPQAYVDETQALFALIGGLYTSIEDTVKVLEKFFGYGDTDVSLNSATPSRVTRTANRTALNTTIQTMALSYSYFYSAQLTFDTVSDIDARAVALEAQFQKVPINEALTTLRLDTQAFFDAEKLTTQQIITVNTPVTSARLLAYKYYGSSDPGAQIAELNATSEPTFMSGDVQILSA